MDLYKQQAKDFRIHIQSVKSCNLESSVSLRKSSQVACKANLIKMMYKCS